MTSDFGERKQILWIRPDLTTLFGATEAGKIQVKDGEITFNYEVSFGDRSFDNAFNGKLQEGLLTGEMVNPMGTQQVKGEKPASPE